MTTTRTAYAESPAARNERLANEDLLEKKTALWLRRREQYRSAAEGSEEQAKYKRLTLAAGHERLSAEAALERRTADKYAHADIARRIRTGQMAV